MNQILLLKSMLNINKYKLGLSLKSKQDSIYIRHCQSYYLRQCFILKEEVVLQNSWKINKTLVKITVGIIKKMQRQESSCSGLHLNSKREFTCSSVHTLFCLKILTVVLFPMLEIHTKEIKSMALPMDRVECVSHD